MQGRSLLRLLLLGCQQRVLLLVLRLLHRYRGRVLPRGQRVVQQQGGTRGGQRLLLRQRQPKSGWQRGLPGLRSSRSCRRRSCCSRGRSRRLLLSVLLSLRLRLRCLLLRRLLHRLRKRKAAAVATRHLLLVRAGAAEAGGRRHAAGLQDREGGHGDREMQVQECRCRLDAAT